MPRHPSPFLDLVRRGAEYRYRELKAELDSLVRHFPYLAEAATSKGTRPFVLRAAQAELPAATPRKRRRRKMSAAARQAISLAQKKRRAAQKAAQKKK